MEGFNVKLEGMFSGQLIPLLSVDGSIQGELRNWSSAVSLVRTTVETRKLGQVNFCKDVWDIY